MNHTTVKLIQTSFAQVEPHADLVAALFYRHLFALDPALRPLFRGDMKSQGRKLMGMLRMVVHGLERLDTLVASVEALGERHAAYGVCDAHFNTVGAALLATLADGLGDDFTPDVQAAWTEAYTILAATMRSGLQRANNAVLTRSAA